MTQALKAGAANARAEGYTPTFAAANVTVRVRTSNQCQISALPFSVTNTQDVIDKAGLGQTSEYDYQKDLKFKELALDMDYILLQGTAVTRDADAGTAGQLTGLLTSQTTNVKNAGSALLTQDLYNQLSQTIAEEGGDPDHVFCAGYQRRMISSWTTPIRQIDSSQTVFSDTVTVYAGDFGQQTVVFDKHMPTTQLALVEMKYSKVAYLRPAFHSQLGLNGDLIEGYVLSEYTLEYLAEQSGGKITNLAVGS